MFPHLPEELERMIWEKFKTYYLIPDIKVKENVWKNPSDNLLKIKKESSFFRSYFRQLLQFHIA